MSLTQKLIDEHRNNLEPTSNPPTGHMLYDFLLETDSDPSFRIYDYAGHRVFGNTFSPEEWYKFVNLVSRFNEKYQEKMMRRMELQDGKNSNPD